MGADPNGDIQYPLWNHFLPVSLLGRDDHVPWHDNAYGNLVYDHMAQKSVRRKRKCRKDPEAEPEAHHRAYYIRRDRNGSILLYFSCIQFLTTIMLIGFVNAGIMKLSQAIPVVFGANVGSTATAQILRLGDLGEDMFILKLLKPSSFAPVLIGIGAFIILFAHKKKHKDIAGILVGLGSS